MLDWMCLSVEESLTCSEGRDLELLLVLSLSVRLSMLLHRVEMVRPLLRLTPSWALGRGVEVVISAWDWYSSLSLSSVSALVFSTLARNLSRCRELPSLDLAVRWDWDRVIRDLAELTPWDVDWCLHRPEEADL